jgi:hypothetical protein
MDVWSERGPDVSGMSAGSPHPTNTPQRAPCLSAAPPLYGAVLGPVPSQGGYSRPRGPVIEGPAPRRPRTESLTDRARTRAEPRLATHPACTDQRAPQWKAGPAMSNE